MKQLLSEILKFIELELPYVEKEAPELLRSLTHRCTSEMYIKHGAVDSSYIVRKIGHLDVLIQTVVGVGDRVKKKYIVQKVTGDIHLQARRNEINFAELLDTDVVLIDGPLTPYVKSGDRLIGVSKDPKMARYGEKIQDRERRELFQKISKLVGERRVAELILLNMPRGSYLEPADLGELYGTFFKSDWVLYVEFPKRFNPEDLCSLFRKYPVRLRLAHHLAKVNTSFLDLVRLFSDDAFLSPRELL
ncbi:MAG: DNA double-strand break repair nuclease NurA [Pyrobaculum sp.]